MKRIGDSWVALGLKRPVLMTVVHLLIILAGVTSLFGLEVRELPNIDRPIVVVRVNYPGASPATMDAEVTSKIEGAVSRVPGIVTLQGASEENNMRVRMEFSPGIDINVAANDVREAVARVQRNLPPGIEEVLIIKADDNARPVVQLAASSATLPMDELADRLEKIVVPAIVSVEGVADVQLDGSTPRSLRVLLDPARLARFNLSPGDVLAGLRTMQSDLPAGSIKSGKFDLLIRADASALTESQVKNITIAPNVRVADVAEVLFAPQTAESYSLLDGRDVIAMGVLRQAGANAIQIAQDVRTRIAQFNAENSDIQVELVSDDSVFIRGALSEVVISLLIAVAVVLLVIALFLGNWRAVLVPAVTMPVSLIGTLAAIWIFGFSINILTLLALVLATGLIVDDAIVVLENIQRRMRDGESAPVASILGTRQVLFAVMATTITLIAVFLPIAFLPGQTGLLFKEFGAVLSISVVLSTFVALTLCPMLAAKALATPPRTDTLIARAMQSSSRFGEKLAQAYLSSLDYFLVHRKIFLGLFLLVALAGVLGFTRLGQELVPAEDRGRLVVELMMPDGTGLNYSGQRGAEVEAALQPYVDQGLITSVFTIVGRWDKNRVYIQGNLTPWAQRSMSQQELARRVSSDLAGFTVGQVRIVQENSLAIRGGGSGLQMAILGANYDELAAVAETFADRLETSIPQVQNVRIGYDTSQPQISFEVNRDRARDLQVPVEQITQAIQLLADEFPLLELSIDDRAVPVLIGSTQGAMVNPSDLLNIYARSDTGALIALASLLTPTEVGVAAELNRYSQQRAIPMDVVIPPGADLGQAIAQVRALAQEVLPSGFSLLFLNEAATLEETSYDMLIIFAIALTVVFLVLAAQFESVGSAAVVMFTVPFGLAAAVFSLIVTGQTLNLYSQVGLVLLIGLMTKNAILLVEMMDQLRDEGLSVAQAIRQGAALRLRPVAMTVFSTLLGIVPLTLSSGPGAEARQAIALVVLGGLGLSALFTLYLAPLGYSLVAPLVKPRASRAIKLERELAGVTDADPAAAGKGGAS